MMSSEDAVGPPGGEILQDVVARAVGDHAVAGLLEQRPRDVGLHGAVVDEVDV